MENFPIDPTDLPIPTYLVGGWVRDMLLQRQKAYLDMDFVVPEGSLSLAKRIANKYQGGFVVLDAQREIARVVLPKVTLDFAKQVGSTLEIDLGRRDFCMNAMAIAMHEPDRIIDPLGGQMDLSRQQIRMVAPENLCDDPLRILRAYRQAAQLGFTIEPWTRQTLRQLAGMLQQVAVERIRMELGHLLAIPEGTPWLCSALQEKILQTWLPSPFLHLDRFRSMDTAIGDLIALEPTLDAYFQRELAAGQTIAMTSKYAALVSSSTVLDSLGLSRGEQRWIGTLLRYLPTFLSLLMPSPPVILQHQLFHDTGEAFPALLAITLASQAPQDLAIPWLQRWLDPHDPIAHPPTLLTGDDLQALLAVGPGPHIRELLEKIRQAQACGTITDRSTAIDYAQQLWQKQQTED